jgi:hypothetical protein
MGLESYSLQVLNDCFTLNSIGEIKYFLLLADPPISAIISYGAVAHIVQLLKTVNHQVRIRIDINKNYFYWNNALFWETFLCIDLM